MNRPSWHTYFMDLAYTVSSRATCPRKSVGCVIVDSGSKFVLTSGYNGSTSGEPHCSEAGCLLVESHCVRTVHAEANAVFFAARRGIKLSGTVAYSTVRPCWNCVKALRSAGIWSVYFSEDYGGDYPTGTKSYPVQGIEVVKL